MHSSKSRDDKATTAFTNLPGIIEMFVVTYLIIRLCHLKTFSRHFIVMLPTCSSGTTQSCTVQSPQYAHQPTSFAYCRITVATRSAVPQSIATNFCARCRRCVGMTRLPAAVASTRTVAPLPQVTTASTVVGDTMRTAAVGGGLR